VKIRFSQLLKTAPLAVGVAQSLKVEGAQVIYLALDGIVGEVTDSAHKGQIEIKSFSLGVSNSGTVGGGKVSFQDMSISAFLSSASPVLSFYCASGKHIQTATLRVADDPGTGNLTTFYTIVLTDVLVTSVTTGGSDLKPVDNYSLNFGQISWTYVPIYRGGPGIPVTRSWNVTENHP
jgi:type VI secretion system secreted protein Hcp